MEDSFDARLQLTATLPLTELVVVKPNEHLTLKQGDPGLNPADSGAFSYPSFSFLFHCLKVIEQHQISSCVHQMLFLCSLEVCCLSQIESISACHLVSFLF